MFTYIVLAGTCIARTKHIYIIIFLKICNGAQTHLRKRAHQTGGHYTWRRLYLSAGVVDHRLTIQEVS